MADDPARGAALEPPGPTAKDPMARAGYATSPENLEMLLQFLGSIEAVMVSTPEPEGGPERAAWERVTELLAKDPRLVRWVDAYQAELLLAQIRPVAQLRNEILRAAEKLRRETSDGTTVFDAEIDEVTGQDLSQTPEGEARARAILMRLLSGQHWKTSQRFLKRQIGLIYTQRIVAWLVGVLALFIGVLLVVALLSPPCTGANACRDTWLVYSGLAVAGSAGLLGASFSTLTGRAATIETVSLEGAQVAASNMLIALRLGVGGTGAMILYFFFEAGLVSGAAFPDLETLGFTRVLAPETNGPSPWFRPLGVYVPNAELSKLMVWSFLAGFSEKLVPAMLGRVEKSGKGG